MMACARARSNRSSQKLAAQKTPDRAATDKANLKRTLCFQALRVCVSFGSFLQAC